MSLSVSKTQDGITQSERELGAYATKSFLRLWSYANLFIDKRTNGVNGQGKELCDRLVVCGDHVIIFSDKSIEWPKDDEIALAWSRWKRRAIDKSVDQVRGAARWIQNFPARIFTDANCTTPVRIPLPSADRLKLHGIVVARGAGEACHAHFGEGSQSLIINSADFVRAVGEEELQAFNIGDVNEGGFYIHVLDDVSLNVVLQELDTISDFVWYLEDKADFMRSGRMVCAHGEEELMTAHLRGMDVASRRHKIAAGIPPGSDDHFIVFGEGLYSEFRQLPEYLSRKEADRISYVWDTLIEHFTEHVLNQTMVTIPGAAMNTTLVDHERGLREMALQCRMQRRILSLALKGAFESIEEKDRFFRLAIVNMPFQSAETGFVFLVLKDNEKTNPNDNYLEYRQHRSFTLYGYLINALKRRPELKRIVGIATELPPQLGGQKGASEDLLFAEAPDFWTENLSTEAEGLRTTLEIWNDDEISFSNLSQVEYPDAQPWHHSTLYQNPIPYNWIDPNNFPLGPALNRRERRKRAALRRKAGRGLS